MKKTVFAHIILLILYASPLFSSAQPHATFKENLLVGLKDHHGHIVIAANYEQLGWSNDTRLFVEGVLGYVIQGKWGLITDDSKRITKADYYSIDPLGKALFLVSQKAPLTNRLLYGIIDRKGKRHLALNYASIELSEKGFIIGQYAAKGISLGFLSDDAKVIIPFAYKNIQRHESLFFAQKKNQSFDIFLSSGEKVLDNVDTFNIQKKGILVVKEGAVGLLKRDGRIIQQPTFKKIILTGRHTKHVLFPTWRVYQDTQLIFEETGDSLRWVDGGVWIRYKNNSVAIKWNNSTDFQYYNFSILQAIKNHLIVKNKNGTVSAFTLGGVEILQDLQQIHYANNRMMVQEDYRWNLYNMMTQKVNTRPYDTIYPLDHKSFVAEKGMYKGVVNMDGQVQINFKLEDVRPFKGNLYVAKILNNWGVFDAWSRRWLVNPIFKKIKIIDENIFVGYYMNGTKLVFDGTKKIKTVFAPVETLDNLLIVKSRQGMYGVVSLRQGKTVYATSYHHARKLGDYIALSNADECILINSKGEPVIEKDSEIELIDAFKDGLFRIKKEKKWGFVDKKNQLIISNRYESVGLPSEGLIPVSFKNKWGLINHGEQFISQPIYDTIYSFQNGLAVVKSQEKYGLINKQGVEMTQTKWQSIRRTLSKYFIARSQNNKVALFDTSGALVLSPYYERLHATPTHFIATQNQKKYLITSSGDLLFGGSHLDIRHQGDFYLLMDE